MASRVNTKFVVLLAGVLFVLFVGVAGLAVLAQLRSGERLIRQGDEAMAQQDYELAAKKYSRAVNRDQSRSDWLEKWRDALLKTVPGSEAAYQKAYREHYLGLLNQLAILNPTDPQRQIDLVSEWDRFVRRGGGSISAVQQIETLVDQRAEQLDPADPKTKELLAYRARAVVDQMLRIQVDEEKADRALKDLRAAVEIDPDDVESAVAIAQWHYAKVLEHRRDVRQVRAEEAMKEFERRLSQLMETHGSDPEVQSFAFRIKVIEGQRTVVSAKDRRELETGLRDDAREALEVIAEADVEELTPSVLSTTDRVIVPYAGEGARERFLEILDRVVEARPEYADALLLQSQALANLGRYAEAYEGFQRVVDMPDKPVSLEGLRLSDYRRGAVQAQVDLLLAQYEQSDDPGEKERLLAEAKARRDVLASMTDVNSESELKLRDAQIAFIEGDVSQAVVLLEEIRRNLREDSPRVLRMLATALTAQGNLGDAARQYERIIATDQHVAADLARLGDLRLQLNEPDLAISAFERALSMDPEYEYAQRRIDAIHTATGEVGGGETVDPIVQALVTAQRATNEGDIEGAISILEEALVEAPGDLRLIRELVTRDLSLDRRAEALERVEAALAANPESRELMVLRQKVAIEDPVEAAEAIIASLDLPPLQQAVQRYYVYERSGMPERASEAFREAEDLDPEHPAVIEIGFLRALAANDWDRASRYATRAAEENIDRRGGLTFKGRLELARGDSRDAEATLQRAVERMQFDPMTWRWLGQAQRQNGKVEAALESFARAYQARPGHAAIAQDYARALVANQQGEEALEVIRRLLGTGERSDRVVDLWLDLEGEFGDRDRALTTRRQIFEGKPDDFENAIAYLNLLLSDEDFEAFDTAITRLEEAEAFSPLQIASLRARSLAEQGRVEEGRELLLGHVRSIPASEMTVEAHMTVGRYEREYGAVDDAITAYEKAREHQDPDLREADRALGDLLFAVARGAEREDEEESRPYYERAAEAYRRVRDSDPDDMNVTKRLAETLIRLDRLQEAGSVLTSIGNDDDLQVLLLRAILAERDNDIRAARGFLDRAVELYPNDPVPFFRRAELNRNEQELFPDVIADLNQATTLRPGMIEAWGLRFGIYRARGQMDEAFAQLRSAIDANPENDALKRLLIETLVAAGRREEAKAEAQQIATANFDDPAWLEEAAKISYRQGSYDEAQRFYLRLYELDPSPLVAADLLNAWFRATEKPPRPEVNRLLRKVREIGDEEKDTTRERVVVTMLKSRAEQWLGHPSEATQLSIEAYRDALEDYQRAEDGSREKTESAFTIKLWFDDLVERFRTDDTNGVEKAFAFLDNEIASLGPLPPVLRLHVIRNELLGGTSFERCAERLSELEEEVQTDLFTKLEFHRLQNQLYYSMGRYEECAEACRAGLEIVATDLELNNNLAYTLAKHLGDPEGALPYAEAAARAAPLNAAVLDTLGWVYHQSGRYRDAERVLHRAITTARTPDELVPAYLHLAQVKLETDDRNEAHKFIRLANEQLRKATTQIKNQYGADVKSLFQELE